MHWNIPHPHAIPDVKPPRWDRWWRGCSLVSMLLLFLAAAGWFWLKDARIWLYAFSSIAGWGLACILAVGWMMYRYGVDREHVEGLRQYNNLLEAEWQRWAQQGLPVLDYSTILPHVVPPVSLAGQQVTSEKAFSPGAYPGAVALLRELLLPLLPGLRKLMLHHSLAVSLPDSIAVKDFQRVWEELVLPFTGISSVEPDSSDIFSRLFRWTDREETNVARLVVFADWDEPDEHTQGAVAWLLGPAGNKSHLPVRCTLHRPKLAVAGGTPDDIRQFLHYQPLAQRASDLWLNAGALGLAAPFMIQRAVFLRVVSPDTALTPELTQRYLPHWLGRVSEESPFFAVTLMMQMAECRKGTQVLLHTGKNVLTFCSVSAGAFSHE